MLLGKGSFACVYRAKSVKTGLEVAIKTVRVIMLHYRFPLLNVMCAHTHAHTL